jgi:hypothetical protein
MEDIIDIIVTETTNTIEITAQPNDEIIDVNIIDNREDIVLNVTPTVVEININTLTGNFGVFWGDIEGTLSNQTDLNNALALKANLVGGKVPASELPSYVDDVVEVANFAALPATGETGKIYITLDTNFIYRWTGSTYVEIKDSSAVWGAITGTLSNQTDLQNALNAKVAGTGTAGQVTFWDGTSSVAGDSGLTYDSTNHLLRLIDTSNTYTSTISTAGFNTEIVSPGSLFVNVGSNVLRGLQIIRGGNTVWNIGGSGNIVSTTAGAGTGASIYAGNTGAFGFYSVGTTLAQNVIYLNNRTNNDNYGVRLAYRNAGTEATGLALQSNGNVLINTTTDSGFRLDVNGTARVQGVLTTTADAVVNEVNIGRGAGNLDTNTRVGNLALIANTTGIRNTAIGTDVLKSNTTGINNTSVGAFSLTNNTTGSGNVAEGIYALAGNTTGSNNTAIGSQALESNNASENTAVGRFALRLNTSGTGNTSIGNETLNSNTTGAHNVSIGHDTMFSNTTGSQNVAIGRNTLFSNTTGLNNNVIGTNALYLSNGSRNSVIGAFSFYLSTGSNNIAIGYEAGRFTGTGVTEMTSVDNSIYLGYQTRGLNATGSTNELVIGYNVVGLGSNTTVLGNTSTTLTALYGAVITGGTSVNASAQFQVDSTTKGFLPPRMTTTQKTAIGTPATGLVVYDTTLNKLSVYTGSAWETVTSI